MTDDALADLDDAAERLVAAIRACLAAGYSVEDITAETGLAAADVIRLADGGVSDQT